MLTDRPEHFVAWWERHRPPPDRPPVMRAAMLVSPVGFRVSEQSARDNRYMVPATPVDPERAIAQHLAVVRALTERGLPVLEIPGRPGLDDAIYPNNVYATIPGRFIVGRMRHPVRRREAEREDVRRLFVDTFRYTLCDLSREPDVIAELTGPLVIDRARGIGWCGMTGRVNEAGCRRMHEAFALRATLRFDLVPEEYHTNLVLAVLAGRGCVVHPGSIVHAPAVLRALEAVYGERILRLTDEEKAAFCGNLIAVTERDVFLSATALAALRPASRATLERWGFTVHAVAIDELEKGGGSLRCLIAEVF
ncbi:MAG: amidinotransferase [Planctomycetota bacterium]|nr:MAG: amidinotransferase [Planctomycetota bacterium]